MVKLTAPCYFCGGSGENIDSGTCALCNGTGKVEKKMSVKEYQERFPWVPMMDPTSIKCNGKTADDWMILYQEAEQDKQELERQLRELEDQLEQYREDASRQLDVLAGVERGRDTATESLTKMKKERDKVEAALEWEREQTERWKDEFAKLSDIRDALVKERDRLLADCERAHEFAEKRLVTVQQYRKRAQDMDKEVTELRRKLGVTQAQSQEEMAREAASSSRPGGFWEDGVMCITRERGHCMIAPESCDNCFGTRKLESPFKRSNEDPWDAVIRCYHLCAPVVGGPDDTKALHLLMALTEYIEQLREKLQQENS